MVKIGAAQLTPVFLDRDATIRKVHDAAGRAAAKGAQLLVFPEAFLPGYPDWVWAVPSGDRETHSRLYAELVNNAVAVPSEASEALCEIARETGIHLVIGINELNSDSSSGSLYNTLLYIDDSGEVIGRHRKLVPTFGERLVWMPGDGGGLTALDTSIGRLGGLICWENYMPLARYAMYASGTQIYVAATWDRTDTWISTLRHIAKEGRMFVIGCCMVLQKADIPDRLELSSYYSGVENWINRGNSAIIDPEGAVIAGPLTETEDILYAEVDLDAVTRAKSMFDVAGHYSRPDVFTLLVSDAPRPDVVHEGLA